MAPENVPGAASLPCDDVAQDFVREFFHRFEAEPTGEVSEAEDGFTIRLQIRGLEYSADPLFVVTDSIAIRDTDRTISVVIIRWGSFERWVLLPAVVDAGHVTTDLIDGVLLVTLPKSAPGVRKSHG